MFFVFVMGEGIEIMLIVLVVVLICVGGYEFMCENVVFWVGINFGNMVGKMLCVFGKCYFGEFDMSDENVFVLFRWCKVFVYFMDGDSDFKMICVKCESGIKCVKCLCPGFEGYIVVVGMGCDYNDILKVKMEV